MNLHKPLLGCLVSLGLVATTPAPAAVVGSITGLVTDDRGMAQMGASVWLLTAEGRNLRRVYTNQAGGFLIDNLFPGYYGVRVSVPSFLPALRERVLVEAGSAARLHVQLANLFSSVQLVTPGDGEWRDMTEDWKWVLRAASAIRPVLRFMPWEDRERLAVLRKFSGAFGPVQGLVQVSAGDGGRVSAFGSENDLGTAFAVATSLFGNHNLLVSGNLGYGSVRGAPSAGFHTSYSRELAFGAQPEISVTVRQLFRPMEAGRALFGPLNRDAAVLQAFTLGYQDRVVVGDMVKLEYGFLYDSISFLDRLNYLSPFGKLSYSLDDDTQVVLSYASGLPRPDSAWGDSGALGRNLSSLGLFPRMSLLGGRANLQRGEHMEIGFQQRLGEDVIEVAAYRDGFSNTAITALVPAGLYTGGDILPDLFSDTATLNAGSYQVTGYRASYSRRVNQHVRAGVAYGLAGVLEPQHQALATGDAGELRAMLKPVRESFVTALASVTLPASRTWIHSSYQWGGRTAVTGADLFNASATRALPGMNLMVRQPLPNASYLPGKFEATADFRNLLAQGYIPIRTSDGRRMFLVPSARSFRGGLNFLF